MGVIKRNENLFEIRYTVSEETLYIPSSDDDDVVSQQFDYQVESQRRPLVARQRPPTVGPLYSNLKSHSGKKKFRRYNNAHQLMTLIEEEEVQEVTIDDFIGNSKSAFSILLEDEKAYQKWDEFISSSEEHQRELLEKDKKEMKRKNERPIINRNLRNLLRKKNVPIGMLNYLEQELVSFFSEKPTKTYISPALSSFQRLLLHSVSNYHHLASLSFESGPDNIKLVRVENPRNEFSLPPLLLVQYLKSTYDLD